MSDAIAAGTIAAGTVLGDAVLAELVDKLRLVRRTSPAGAAARCEQIADALASGPPPRELFVLLAAVALIGAAACAARDLAREPAQPV